jgi:hypothetical protein
LIGDSTATIKKTLGWHLFKGGLKISELENPTNAEVIIAQGIENINKYSEVYKKAITDFLRSGSSQFSSYFEKALTTSSEQPP